MARLLMRPYEHFTQEELTDELEQRAEELLSLVKTAHVVVSAWASGSLDTPFDFKMLRMCRLPLTKARLLRHAAREAQARAMKPKTGKRGTSSPNP